MFSFSNSLSQLWFGFQSPLLCLDHMEPQWLPSKQNKCAFTSLFSVREPNCKRLRLFFFMICTSVSWDCCMGKRKAATEPDRVFRVVRIRFLSDHTYDRYSLSYPPPPLSANACRTVRQTWEKSAAVTYHSRLARSKFLGFKKTVLGFVVCTRVMFIQTSYSTKT